MRSLNLKRVATAVIGGVLLAVVPYLLWNTFLRQIPLTEPGTATISGRFASEPVRSAEPEPDSTRVRELLPNATIALIVDSSSGMLRMYEADTGRSFEINPSTLRVQTISDRRLDGFLDTVWSPNGKEVISTFSTPDGTQFRYYDYRTGQSAVLQPGTGRVAFSPDGSRIASWRSVPDGSQLWLSRPDGSEASLVVSTRLAITGLSWPTAETLYLVSVHTDGTSDLIAVSKEGKLTRMRSGLSGPEIVWSPKGSVALLSSVEKGIAVLSILNGETGTVTPLKVRTRASKCAWHRDGTAVTCGIPDQQSTAASRENIVTVSLSTGTELERYRPGAGVFLGVENPAMLTDGSGFVFVNTFGQKPNLVSW